MKDRRADKLGRKEEVAIAALLTENTIGEAAAKAGVCERTLKNWLVLPEFATAYRAARQEVLDRAVTRLLTVCGEAVDTLRACLTSAKPGDRIRAAVAILDHAIKGTDQLDVIERIKALEGRKR